MSNLNTQLENVSGDMYPTESPAVSRWGSFCYLGFIALILLLAFALRVWNLNNQSFTIDELHELRFVTEGMRAIVIRPDGFPPLYQLILYCWLALFPMEEAARYLSVLLGLASILFGWRLAIRIGGRKAGLWVFFLLAVSPFHIYYSQEARAYALYYALAALALWLFFRAVDSDRVIDWILFVLAASTGIYAHYYFYMLVLTTGILFAMKQGSFIRWRWGQGAFVSIFILSLPAIWLLYGDLAFQSSSLLKVPFNLSAFCYTCLVFVTGFTIGPSLVELHTMSRSQAILGILPWALIIGPACIILAYHGLVKLREENWHLRLLFLAFIPLLTLGIVGHFAGVGYNVRYVVWCSLPVTIWAAAGIARGLTRPTIALSLAALLSVSAVALYNRHYVSQYQNEDVKSMAAYLQSLPGERLPIFVMVNYMRHPVQYYLKDGWKVYPLPYVGSDKASLDHAFAVIEHRLPASGFYWLVYTRAFHGDPQNQLRTTMLKRGIIHPQAKFPGIVLYRGKWDKKSPGLDALEKTRWEDNGLVLNPFLKILK